MSELTWCRDRLAKYCKGNTLDVGFGDAVIVPHAICLDRAEGDPRRAPGPYKNPTHWVGDAMDLPFKDGVLDTLFSSHCLEDFESTADVLREWLRVLKPGGYLVLFLPDQQRYVKHCREHGQQPNGAHKIPHFSLAYVKDCLKQFKVEVVHELDQVPGNPYSFDVVVRKLC